MAKNRFWILGVVLILTGCGRQNAGIPKDPIAASTLQQIEAKCEQLASAHAEFWTSHDMDMFEGVYTEDIVHDDGETFIQGAEDVSSMANTVFMFFPGLQATLQDLYVGGEECLGIYDYFPLQLGGTEFTAEEPLIEIDLLRPQGNRIAYWGLFEDHATIEKEYSNADVDQWLEHDRELLERYAEAWSSDDPAQVAALYASDASRQDLMSGDMQSGSGEIRSWARTFFQQFPDARWQLVMPFSGNLSGMPVTGGTYTLRVENQDPETCTIEAAVLLGNSGSEIVKETVFYDAASLVECGWAE